MGNVLEFYLKMKDMMSSGLAAVAKNGRASMDTIYKAVQKVQTGLQNARKLTDTLGSSYNALTKRAGQLEQTIKNSTSISHIRAARRELEQLQRQIDSHPATKSGNGARGGGGILSGLMGRLAPAAMLAGALTFGVGASNAATRYESTNKSFEVLTQSKQKGGALAGELNKLQQETILGPEVFKGAQTMLAFGVAADKVVPSVKMLGDVAMGDADRFNSLALAFAQVTSAGKLQGQDLLQFVNAGFNPLNEIAKQTGKSMGQLKDDMRDGAISSDMVARAFEAATAKGGQFYKMMDQMAETTGGKQAQLAGSYEAMKIAIGERMAPAVKAYTENLIGLTGTIKKWFEIPMSQKLGNERTEVQLLVKQITQLNEGNDMRKRMIDQLMATYPDLFGNIDAEKVKNAELLKTLEDINGAYQRRIDLAVKSEFKDEAQQEADRYWKMYLQSATAHERNIKQYGMDEVAKHKDEDYGAIGGNFNNMLKFKKKYEDAMGKVSEANKAYRQQELQYKADEITNFKNMGVFKGHPNEEAQFNQFRGMVRTMGGSYLQSNDASQYLQWMQGNFGKKKAGELVATDGGSKKEGKKSGESVARGIAGSGPRTINIYGVKFMEKMENHFTQGGADLNDIEQKLQNMFLRLLNSGAAVQD